MENSRDDWFHGQLGRGLNWRYIGRHVYRGRRRERGGYSSHSADRKREGERTASDRFCKSATPRENSCYSVSFIFQHRLSPLQVPSSHPLFHLSYILMVFLSSHHSESNARDPRSLSTGRGNKIGRKFNRRERNPRNSRVANKNRVNLRVKYKFLKQT